MKRRGFRFRSSASAVVALPLMATQAWAEPCVGAAFDTPFPGATGVVTRYADVPSPRFPGLWQEGLIRGYPYVLYANGEADLRDSRRDPMWVISVACDPGATTCVQEMDGTPPEVAVAIATQLGQCFVAPETVTTPAVSLPKPVTTPAVPLPEPVAEPRPAPAPTQAAPPSSLPPLVPGDDDEVVRAPCGLDAVPEGEPGITLQLLLVEAGADPGPIDGLPGQKTLTALGQVLNVSPDDLTLEEAVAAMNSFLCEPD